MPRTDPAGSNAQTTRATSPRARQTDQAPLCALGAPSEELVSNTGSATFRARSYSCRCYRPKRGFTLMAEDYGAFAVGSGVEYALSDLPGSMVRTRASPGTVTTASPAP